MVENKNCLYHKRNGWNTRKEKRTVRAPATTSLLDISLFFKYDLGMYLAPTSFGPPGIATQSESRGNDRSSRVEPNAFDRTVKEGLDMFFRSTAVIFTGDHPIINSRMSMASFYRSLQACTETRPVTILI
ncbi:MAG: hypothetical protein U9R75_06220 [Candidatus Thermoplasmatota archaeon]|nr:hypothetical protein [Candidatus Thermoplasmatota archaeon]